MKKFIYENSLAIVFLGLFIFSIFGQIFFGLSEFNKTLLDNGATPVDTISYLSTGHFLEATFENWESEFLQMALLVWFTIFLRQKGSSKSKSLEEPEEVDREPNSDKEDAPWAVKKGGIILQLYKHSLTIILFILFFLSFALHVYGSLKDENTMNELEGKTMENLTDFLTGSKLWFESFQNWQSEFLSVFAIIMLSIYLRQKGSSQSKPVDAAHSETGN